LINPAVLLDYLPPGKSKKESNFIKKAKQLVPNEVYNEVFLNDSSKIFESLTVEYCFELNLPGKALSLLIEALKYRQIHAL
jgi:hypothetical protein